MRGFRENSFGLFSTKKKYGQIAWWPIGECVVHIFGRFKETLKVVPRCPDNHDLSECRCLYDLGRYMASRLLYMSISII